MILIIFLIIFNLLVILNLKKISQILNIYDHPDGKLKIHKLKVPIIGGIFLAINFSIVFLFQILFSNSFLSFDIDQLSYLELISLLILLYSYFFLGLYDDKYHLTPFKKLTISILIILITIFLNKNLIISSFNLSFIEKKIFLKDLSILFTIFCILILINSLNFYDGINGQSCLIFLSFFSYLLFIGDANLFYLISIILILLVMLLNLKNMLFLGDGGVYLLTIILSISLIYEHNINKNIYYVDEIFFLLLLPGLDLLRLTILRSLNSKNPFLGDRNHIHHLLINKFSLIFSNIILLFLSTLPIILFMFFKINFFLIFSLIVFIYIILIQFLKSSGMK